MERRLKCLQGQTTAGYAAVGEIGLPLLSVLHTANWPLLESFQATSTSARLIC
jgi:hypothetical protein